MRHSIDIQQHGPMVLVVLDGRRLLDIGWKPALEVCECIDRLIKHREHCVATGVDLAASELGVKVNGAELSFRLEGDMVVCVGKASGSAPSALLFDAGVVDARRIWRGLLEGARLAEEHDKADAIIADAAILDRSGAPIGLSNNPKIRAEARKEALGNRDLRRFMSNGIRTAEALPAPTVTHDIRTPAEQLADLASKMSPEQRARLARQIATA